MICCDVLSRYSAGPSQKPQVPAPRPPSSPRLVAVQQLLRIEEEGAFAGLVNGSTKPGARIKEGKEALGSAVSANVEEEGNDGEATGVITPPPSGSGRLTSSRWESTGSASAFHLCLHFIPGFVLGADYSHVLILAVAF